MAEERMSQFEDMVIETSKTESQNKSKSKKQKRKKTMTEKKKKPSKYSKIEKPTKNET